MANSCESKKSYYYDNDFRNYFESLGDAGREEFMGWLSSLRQCNTHRNSSLNYDFCVTYENDLIKCGTTLVYLYTSEMGIPFYVGKGTTDRATNIYKRPEAFMDKLNEYGTCRVFVIACNARDEYALDIETLALNELLDRGWRLTNTQKVAVGERDKKRLREEYPEIIEVINKITGKAVSYLLEEHDTFGDSGRVRIANKSMVKAVEEVS